MVIGNTAAGGIGLTLEQRTDSVFRGNPELASLDVGPICFRGRLKKRPAPLKGRDEDIDFEFILPADFTATTYQAKVMLEHNVKPEFEVFSTQSWWYVDNIIQKGLAKPPYWCQLVFGQPGASSAPTVMSAIEMIDNMPDDALFSAIGIGPLQLPITTLSLIMGGHIRVGMEDNVYYRRGELAKSNAQFVERAVRIIHELNREVATPMQAREMLGISMTPTQYT